MRSTDQQSWQCHDS